MTTACWKTKVTFCLSVVFVATNIIQYELNPFTYRWLPFTTKFLPFLFTKLLSAWAQLADSHCWRIMKKEIAETRKRNLICEEPSIGYNDCLLRKTRPYFWKLLKKYQFTIVKKQKGNKQEITRLWLGNVLSEIRGQLVKEENDCIVKCYMAWYNVQSWSNKDRTRGWMIKMIQVLDECDK